MNLLIEKLNNSGIVLRLFGKTLLWHQHTMKSWWTRAPGEFSGKPLNDICVVNDLDNYIAVPLVLTLYNAPKSM